MKVTDYMTCAVNGVTELVWKCKDTSHMYIFTSRSLTLDALCLMHSNEYAMYTYPDGRERHTGREQPPQLDYSSISGRI